MVSKCAFPSLFFLNLIFYHGERAYEWLLPFSFSWCIFIALLAVWGFWDEPRGPCGVKATVDKWESCEALRASYWVSLSCNLCVHRSFSEKQHTNTSTRFYEVTRAVPRLMQGFLPWVRFALDCGFLNQNVFWCGMVLRSDSLTVLRGLRAVNVSDGCQHDKKWVLRLM